MAGVYDVREMMFGLGERHRYFQCGACDCLQIVAPPEDLARYYPPNYYAYEDTADIGKIRRFLRRRRNHYAFFGRGLIGRALNQLAPYPRGEAHRWLRHSALSADSHILDVGCGSGGLLRDLREQGFRNLLGVDPYIETDIQSPNGFSIRKATVDQIQGRFDLIMLHHTLEHIPDPETTLQSVARLLAPEGECLIRVPLVSSYAWEHYREDWVQIDAPRHLFLHSVESMRLLGERAGLRLLNIEYDSTEFQFVGSEMYRRDLPLTCPTKGLFSRKELREYRRRARALNAEGRGDTAAFYFTRLRTSSESEPLPRTALHFGRSASNISA